jgi:hypothetical protein
MATELRNGPDVSMSGLVTGIIKDVQDLLAQQLTLFKEEIARDVRQTKEAAKVLALGLGVCLGGIGLLLLMLVHLLNWATNNALPLWACYGIVGGVLAVLGGVLLYLGKSRIEAIPPFPQESAQALKENVECLMNPK